MMHQYETLAAKARHCEKMEMGDKALVKQVLEVFPAYIERQKKRLLGRPIPPDEAIRVQTAYDRFYREQYGAWTEAWE